MSEEKIKDFMTKDPQASKFLSNMIPGGAQGAGDADGADGDGAGRRSKEGFLEKDQNSSNQRSGAQMKIRNLKVNQMQRYQERYKWPYYDSYAPNVAMHKPVEQIVKKSINK